MSFYDVVGRTIPMSRHGKLWAYRLFFGGILSALCGLAIGAILALPEFSLRFGILFALATLFVGLGTGAFTRCDEPPVEVSRKALHMGVHLRENLRVAWGDSAFRALFGTRVALAAAGMATPFYVVYAVRGLGLPALVVAGFVSAKIAGFVSSNLLWQRVASRHGPTDLMRRVTVISAAGPLIALTAGVAPEPARGPLLIATFFLLGASVSGTSIAFQSLLLGIAPAARRPSYVGLMNSFVGPATALPALGGLLVDYTAPWVVFGLSVACAALAFGLAGRLPRGVTIEATRPPGREGEPEQA
ncbi:MAG: MFS transporter [Candidatus Eiseniibacteriota bacterium]